jgi:type I restriction enzyme S subunit
MKEASVYKLGDLTSKIGSGATPKGGSNAYKEKGISLIRSQNVLDYSFSFDGLAFIDEEQANLLKNVEVKNNDVLINITGDSVARCCIVPEKVLPARVNQHVAILRLKREYAYYKYIFYRLQAIKEELLMIAEIGATRRALTKGMLEDLEILLPPLPEQKAIASVLSSLDDKIDLLHRQNKTLEAMAETLFRKWFVEEAREDWEVGCLGDVIELFDHLRVPLSKMERDKMKEGDLYPYYGAAKVMDYINDYIFDGEYILLGEDGTVRTDEGFPILQYATGKFWVNNHTHVIKAKPPYSNFFLWNYLKRKNIDEIITGAVQPKINQANLKSLEFPKFPINLIEEFNIQTEPSFKKINANKSQIRTLEKLRDTLLPKLMSGEVRVEYEN